MKKRSAAPSVACAIVATGLLAPASGADDFGSLSCDDLWQARNTIFAQKGHCFRSEHARAAFGAGCFPPYGKLTSSERAQVNSIRQAEAAKDCAGEVGPVSTDFQAPPPETPPGPEDTTADAAPPVDADGGAEVVTVLVGGDADIAACSSGGEVIAQAGEAIGADVRNGPADPTYSAIDSLPVGSKAYICDRRGQWLGIVYSNDDNTQLSEACGVEVPLPNRIPYASQCSSGWILASQFKQTSG